MWLVAVLRGAWSRPGGHKLSRSKMLVWLYRRRSPHQPVGTGDDGVIHAYHLSLVDKQISACPRHVGWCAEQHHGRCSKALCGPGSLCRASYRSTRMWPSNGRIQSTSWMVRETSIARGRIIGSILVSRTGGDKRSRDGRRKGNEMQQMDRANAR